MGEMFRRNHVFNQNVGGWDTSSVTDMNKFADNTAFNQDIDIIFQTNRFGGVFKATEESLHSINTLRLIPHVTDMSSMFASNTTFNLVVVGILQM